MDVEGSRRLEGTATCSRSGVGSGEGVGSGPSAASVLTWSSTPTSSVPRPARAAASNGDVRARPLCDTAPGAILPPPPTDGGGRLDNDVWVRQ